jgi:hypothetical protein
MADKDMMYPGADDSMDEESPEPKSSKREETHQTALLPLKFFEGQELKPGEQYYVTVERLFENEVEVSYPKKDEVKGEEETPGNEPDQTPDDALDGMATEKGY